MYEEEVIVSTLEGCKKVLPLLPDINTEVGEEGGTLLEIVCAFTNDVEVVKYLLEQGADIHHTDKYGRNAFAYAARYLGMKKITLQKKRTADRKKTTRDTIPFIENGRDIRYPVEALEAYKANDWNKLKELRKKYPIPIK